ncbi:MAG TPA: transporter substrate-binding domain-containing protein [Vicinamibacteria bacterium]|nr:transporter substrate-binding domain-containing protein [Vicinamibacteria bacterium]
MDTRLFALVLTTSLAAVSPASAQSPVLDRILESRELRVATSGTQPPFNAISRDQKLIGLEVDLARMLADAMNVNLTLTSMPFPDLLPALKDGKVDMVLSGLAITPARIREVAFVGPYLLSGKSVLTDSRRLTSMKGPRDLDLPELTLVALANSTSVDYVKRVAPKAKLVTTANYEAAVQMILSDTADAMIADMPVCILTVLRNPNKDLATPSLPFTVEPVGIALPTSDERFRNLVEAYVDAFEKTGALEELRARWLSGGEWIAQLP